MEIYSALKFVIITVAIEMRILIIRADVLGSNLAHSLKKNNDITILARNTTHENIKNNGLVIKHKLERKKSTILK